MIDRIDLTADANQGAVLKRGDGNDTADGLSDQALTVRALGAFRSTVIVC